MYIGRSEGICKYNTWLLRYSVWCLGTGSVNIQRADIEFGWKAVGKSSACANFRNKFRCSPLKSTHILWRSPVPLSPPHPLSTFPTCGMVGVVNLGWTFGSTILRKTKQFYTHTRSITVNKMIFSKKTLVAFRTDIRESVFQHLAQKRFYARNYACIYISGIGVYYLYTYISIIWNTSFKLDNKR